MFRNEIFMENLFGMSKEFIHGMVLANKENKNNNLKEATKLFFEDIIQLSEELSTGIKKSMLISYGEKEEDEKYELHELMDIREYEDIKDMVSVSYVSLKEDRSKFMINGMIINTSKKIQII